MFFDPRRHQQTLLAAVAIAVAYAGYASIVRHREFGRLAIESVQQQDAIELLEQRLEEHPGSLAVSSVRHSAVDDRQTQMADGFVVSANEQPTVVATFTDLFDLIYSTGVTCVSATPEYPDADLPTVNSASYRLTLSGSFDGVRKIVDTVKATLPNLAVTELSLARLDASTPCEWELVVSFSEVTP